MIKPFVIEPHFRLQEWVAEEKGYFRDEGLDYVFQELIRSTDGKHHDRGDKVGAFQSFERGRAADVSCACHWTVNVAASTGKGKLYADAYSVAPAGVFVPADSAIRTPGGSGRRADLGRLTSRAATTRRSRPWSSICRADKINLSFADGMLFARMDRLLDGTAPACALFSGPYYFAEQLGFRKVIDTTFMIATMITGDPDPEDLRNSSGARAGPARHRPPARALHALLPERVSRAVITPRMDTRRWGPGNGWCSSPTRRRHARGARVDRRATASSRTATWAPGSYAELVSTG